jgi:hypothetical protein
MSPSPHNLDLSSVTAPPLIEDAKDKRLAEEEYVQFEREKRRIEVASAAQDLADRTSWGRKVFWLLVVWLVLVVAAVTFQGFGWFRFHISDSVLIALISTTTANVLSLGYIVANYLFPKR